MKKDGTRKEEDQTHDPQPGGRLEVEKRGGDPVGWHPPARLVDKRDHLRHRLFGRACERAQARPAPQLGVDQAALLMLERVCELRQCPTARRRPAVDAQARAARSRIHDQTVPVGSAARHALAVTGTLTTDGHKLARVA